jgi:hypothetical protein
MIQQMFPTTQAPAPEPHPPAPPTGPRLILLLRCTHCPPSHATRVVCGCCLQPLASPLDQPFNPVANAALDWMTVIEDLGQAVLQDRFWAPQSGQEVVP